MEDKRFFPAPKKVLAALVASIGIIAALPALADAEIDALKRDLAEQKQLIQGLLADKAAKSDAAATATAAPAASGVTFFGTADVNVARVNSGFGSKWSVGSGGMTASSLGVKGERDLGAGLKAIGTLEAGVAYDTGAASNGAVTNGINNSVPSTGGLVGSGPQLFSRQAFAGLSGDFGALTLGRQYTGSYIAAAIFGNAMGPGFFGSSATFLPIVGGMPTRVNNSLVYRSPKAAGLSAHLTATTGSENNVDTNTAVGATTTTDKAGQGWDAALLYSNGALLAALSTWDVNNSSFVTAGETALAKKRGAQLVANYNFGVVRVYGAFVTGKISGGNYENVTKTLSDSTGASVSASLPFGKSTVYVSYSELDDKSLLDKDGTLVGVAYAYELYKNTKLYASWGKQTNKGASTYSLADGGDLVGVVKNGFSPSGVMAGFNVSF